MRKTGLVLLILLFFAVLAIAIWSSITPSGNSEPSAYPLDLTESLRNAGGSPELPAGEPTEKFAIQIDRLDATPKFQEAKGIEGLSTSEGALAFMVTGEDNLLAWNLDLEAHEATHLELAMSSISCPDPHEIVWQRSRDERGAWNAVPFFKLTEDEGFSCLVPLEDSFQWKGRIVRVGLRFGFMAQRMPAAVSISRLRLLHMDTGTRLRAEGRKGRIDRAVILNESRSVVHAPAPSSLRVDAAVPEGVKLDFAVGVLPTNHNKPGGGVTFCIRFRDESGKELSLYQRTLDIKSRIEDRRWFDERVDLSPLAGKRGFLVFETLAAEDGCNDALWAHPVLYGASDGTARPNLLLLCLDTLRADHLGCYGYPRSTSPELDAIAEEGILFEQAIAQAPETVSSHMTLFTSLHPSAHGIHLPYQGTSLRQEIPTLAEMLKEEGFATAAFTEGGGVSSDLGFDKGFDRYHNGTPGTERPHKMTEATFDHTFDWLERNRDRRHFLFVHTYETHTPYDPPPPFDRQFGPPYEGPMNPPVMVDEVRQLLYKGKIKYGSPELERIIALYDGGIRYADTFLARLREKLDRLGLLDDTIIVILSDHGEDLLDHFSLASHGHSLYEELVRVPLVIRPPANSGYVPSRVSTPVGLIDLAPTLLDMLGIEVPDNFQGRSVLPLLEGKVMEEQPQFMEDQTLIERYGIRYGNRKCIISPKIRENPLIPLLGRCSEQLALHRFEGLFEEEETFDLAADPKETRNLNAEGIGLKSKLEGWIRRLEAMRRAGGVEKKIDSVTLERLRALGYLR